jgi:predicted dehydrogenase
MASETRIGIVGTGGLGTGLGRMAVGAAGANLVALADVSEENLAAAGDELGVPEADRYGEYEAMLDEADLDAVFIATPHTLHHGQVVAAMERDLHVLCEKPLATDLDDARDLVARDEARDEVLQVGYQRHIEPPYATARDHLDDFENVKLVTASVTQDWISGQEGAWRSNPDLSGGGQLYDTGSHLVDVVLWTTDLTPTAVDASMVFHDDEERVDKQATLDVEFGEDAVASISVSGDAPTVREHVHVWGDDGAVYVDGRGWNERQVHLVDPDGAERHPAVWAQNLPANKVEAFVESVQEGTEPVATARDALKVTAVTEAAYESARTGERVELDDL